MHRNFSYTRSTSYALHFVWNSFFFSVEAQIFHKTIIMEVENCLEKGKVIKMLEKNV